MPNNDYRKLRNCPFCGGEAVLFTNPHLQYTEYRVCCYKCHVTQASMYYYTEAEATDAWNRRYTDET